LYSDMKTAHNFVSTGPPKLSLNLKATDPAVRGAVLSGGAITARGATAGVIEPAIELPNELKEERATVVPSIATVAAKLGEAAIAPVSAPPATPGVQQVSEKTAEPGGEKIAEPVMPKAVEPIAEKVGELITAKVAESPAEKITEPTTPRAAHP